MIRDTTDIKIDVQLLPRPSEVFRLDIYNIRIWGWPGIDIEQEVKQARDAQRIIERLLDRGQGVFFLLIENKKDRQYYFWADRFSAKKIFIHQEGDTVYLADFIHKFNRLESFRPELDKVSLALYLNYGYIPTNDTLYKGVRSLKPFHYYKHSNNRLQEIQYFDVEWKENQISYGEAVTQISELFEQRFLHLTRHFDRFLIPLSGGRDSRYLLALALKHFKREQISTFTMGQAGTFDFEIGRKLSKKLGVKTFERQFTRRDHLERVVRPSTYFKNGLINHAVQTPGKFYESVLGDDTSTLILSGYIGDAVLAWSHQKSLEEWDGALYPRTNHFSIKEGMSFLTSEERKAYFHRLSTIAGYLHDNISGKCTENWFYYARTPSFTNTCMFSEDKSYPFSLPFVENRFFDYLMRVPRSVKARPGFYEDVLKQDPSVYRLFSYPLKNLKGKAYNVNPLVNNYYRAKFRLLSLKNGGHAMKNYLNFRAVYSKQYLQSTVESLKRHRFLNPLLSNNDDDMSFLTRTLLVSLNLNLNYFFSARMR